MRRKNCHELEADKAFHEVAIACFEAAAQHSSEEVEENCEILHLGRSVNLMGFEVCTFKIQTTDT